MEEVQLAQDAATTVVESRTEQPDWATTLREVAAAIGFQPGEATPEQIGRALTRTLSELLWTVLATEVVADRLTSAQRLQGRGAWLTGLGPVGELPGPQWRAPRRVLDRLYAAVWPLSTRSLLEVVERHQTKVSPTTNVWPTPRRAGRSSPPPAAPGRAASTRCRG